VPAYLPPERTHFKELLLAHRFSDLAAPTAGDPPTGNTTYEELVCVGYQPQLKQLNAVVHLNLSNGYLGDVCTAGSQEYVKFFASTDDGTTWTALGITSFTAWDVSGAKPLEFDVTLPVNLAETCCKDENIVLIRAILSWQVPPGDATDSVVWGNGLDAHVQVAPLALGTLANLLECLEIPFKHTEVGQVVDLDQVVEFGAATELVPVQLHELYSGTEIPQHRYLLSAVTQLLDDASALSAAANQPEFELMPGLTGIVDVGEVVKVIADPQGDETFEQLGCVGLNTSASTLIATIDVKLPSGYLGNLCTAGSNEYVAFWADWGTGYEYVGTTSVNVHDIASIPADGLQYSVALPFLQAITQRQPCANGAQTVLVRAVLSWATPPSNTDAYAVPVWGGHLETNVLIPPGEPITGGGPDLESIGSMALESIDQTTGLATGQSGAGFVANDCPFGGQINFTGHVINASGGVGGPGLQYRILISTTSTGSSFTPMTQPFQVHTHNWSSGVSTPVLQTPDSEGWCDCLEDYSASVGVVENILGYWQTSGNETLWIAMEVREGVNNPLGPTTPSWTLIRLDNEAPSVTVEITSGGGSCGDFKPGDVIEGSYSARDNEDLNSVALNVEPTMNGPEPKLTPSISTLTEQAGTWQLATETQTPPCGYVIRAVAADNTIVDSGHVGWIGEDYAGFCLRP
jgi:hypothetical protein